MLNNRAANCLQIKVIFISIIIILLLGFALVLSTSTNYATKLKEYNCWSDSVNNARIKNLENCNDSLRREIIDLRNTALISSIIKIAK